MGIPSGRTPLGEDRQGHLQAGTDEASSKWDPSRRGFVPVGLGGSSSSWAPPGGPVPDHTEDSAQ